LLVNIVAKGGNLLLGVGPNGKGDFEPKVYENLDLLGKWLQINGEAIYETYPVEPFLEGKVAYTAKGDNAVYAIYMPAKDEIELPAEISIKTNLSGKLKATLLESKLKLNIKTVDGKVLVAIPQKIRAELAKKEAVVIKIVSD
jgi:alpha-L-fucosidase